MINKEYFLLKCKIKCFPRRKLNKRTHLQRPTHRSIVTAIVHGDVLPDLGGYVERPDLVGHGGVLQGTAIHKYFVAKEHARVSVTRQRRTTLDVRRFPDIAIIIIHVYHLGTVETLAANHI